MDLPAVSLWILLPVCVGIGMAIGLAVTAVIMSREQARYDYLQRSKPETRSVDTIDEFVKMTVASGLVDAQVMDRLLAEFSAGRSPSVGGGEATTALSTFLVAKNALTCWQVAKLRNGQYKGFFELEWYRLLDLLSKNDVSLTCLAQHEASGEIVVVEIFPPDRVSRKINFRVVCKNGTNSG
jgi:hypothetical protein